VARSGGVVVGDQPCCTLCPETLHQACRPADSPTVRRSAAVRCGRRPDRHCTTRVSRAKARCGLESMATQTDGEVVSLHSNAIRLACGAPTGAATAHACDEARPVAETRLSFHLSPGAGAGRTGQTTAGATGIQSVGLTVVYSETCTGRSQISGLRLLASRPPAATRFPSTTPG